MKKLFISCPMRGRTEEAIRATMEQMQNIAEAIFEQHLEVVLTYFEGNPPKGTNERLWYLGESIKKMSEADYYIGVYDEQNGYDGCVIENKTALLYGLPRFLVNIAYVAPDVMKVRSEYPF